MREELGKLVPGLLSLVAGSEKAAVRCAAVNTLTSLTSLPYEELHVFKREVLRCVGKALDDPKRNVRTAAVRCREKWTIDGI